MKEFDLEKAKAKHPLQTRDGRPARIICYDMQGTHSIVALVKDTDGDEHVSYYHENGKALVGDSGIDLFLAPIKKEGWINIYSQPYDKKKYVADISGVYHTEEEAKANTTGLCITTKIEWEEWTS